MGVQKARETNQVNLPKGKELKKGRRISCAGRWRGMDALTMRWYQTNFNCNFPCFLDNNFVILINEFRTTLEKQVLLSTKWALMYEDKHLYAILD